MIYSFMQPKIITKEKGKRWEIGKPMLRFNLKVTDEEDPEVYHIIHGCLFVAGGWYYPNGTNKQEDLVGYPSQRRGNRYIKNPEPSETEVEQVKLALLSNKEIAPKIVELREDTQRWSMRISELSQAENDGW